MTEYISLSLPEKVYGEKNLLQAQLELLTSLKKLKEYRKLRNDEAVLKIALKNKLSELSQQIITLGKLLPHVRLHQESEFHKFNTSPLLTSETLSIEHELSLIREKLSKIRQ